MPKIVLLMKPISTNFYSISRFLLKLYGTPAVCCLYIKYFITLENIGLKRMLQNEGLESVGLCRPLKEIWPNLSRCNRKQWIRKCKLLNRTCTHYATCINDDVSLKAGLCTSEHKFSDYLCCELSCP